MGSISRGRGSGGKSKKAGEVSPASRLPKHWWEAQDEAEEARWWDANFKRLLEEGIRKGTLRRRSVEEILREARRRERGKGPPAQQLTLRIPVKVIEAAKAEAARAKVPYQTLMRTALSDRFRGRKP
jgi:predicted DNA binding CopG/RHH family protein